MVRTTMIPKLCLVILTITTFIQAAPFDDVGSNNELVATTTDEPETTTDVLETITDVSEKPRQKKKPKNFRSTTVQIPTTTRNTTTTPPPRAPRTKIFLLPPQSGPSYFQTGAIVITEDAKGFVQRLCTILSTFASAFGLLGANQDSIHSYNG